MKVTLTSTVSNTTHTVNVPLTEAQYELLLMSKHPREVNPKLTPYQRAFLLTGMTLMEWYEQLNTLTKEELIKNWLDDIALDNKHSSEYSEAAFTLLRSNKRIFVLMFEEARKYYERIK